MSHICARDIKRKKNTRLKKINFVDTTTLVIGVTLIGYLNLTMSNQITFGSWLHFSLLRGKFHIIYNFSINFFFKIFNQSGFFRGVWGLF